MIDEDLEKLIEDMAEEYARAKEYYYLIYYKFDDTSDYESLKHAFIEGFKAGMKFKEERK